MLQTLSCAKTNAKNLLYSLLPYFKKKRILIVFFLVIAILVAALLLSISTKGNNGILPYQQNIEVLSYHDGMRIAVDETVLDEVIYAEKCQKISKSLDGTIAAFLTDTKELYIVQEQELRKIADDVLHFEISSSGRGVAFAQKYAKQNALTLYSLGEQTRREITTCLTRLDFSLSPDGQTVAYYTQSEEREALMCYRKGQTTEITSQNVDLVGLCNDGKYIYASSPVGTGLSTLYAYDYRGKAAELGSVTSSSYKFNHDHRQIMFYNNGKTLISTNGQAAITASSYPLYLVTAPNSQSASDGNSITLPVTTLFGHVYTCSDGEATSAWLIQKDPHKSEKLVSKVSSCSMDASTRYMYFIHDHTKLCMINVANGVPGIRVLAENATSYAVTSNLNRVYYADQGSLYCLSQKKNSAPRLIASDFTGVNLVIGSSDSLYYINDTNVYACHNGRKTKLVAENISSLYSSSNNVVYMIGDDHIYIANSRKHPINITENN